MDLLGRGASWLDWPVSQSVMGRSRVGAAAASTIHSLKERDGNYACEIFRRLFIVPRECVYIYSGILERRKKGRKEWQYRVRRLAHLVPSGWWCWSSSLPLESACPCALAGYPDAVISGFQFHEIYLKIYIHISLYIYKIFRASPGSLYILFVLDPGALRCSCISFGEVSTRRDSPGDLSQILFSFSIGVTIYITNSSLIQPSFSFLFIDGFYKNPVLNFAAKIED